MSTLQAVQRLIRDGDDVARTQRPAARRKKWDRWSRSVTETLEHHPDLRAIGLSLSFATLPDGPRPDVDDARSRRTGNNRSERATTRGGPEGARDVHP